MFSLLRRSVMSSPRQVSSFPTQVSAVFATNNPLVAEATGATTTTTSVRNGWTKQRKKRYLRHLKRQEMAKEGIPVPKPPGWMDPKALVANAVPREEQQRKVQERRQNQHLGFNKPQVNPSADPSLPPLVLPLQTSVHETEKSLKMSPKVAKMLSLKNGNQKRVVQAQKAAGMKLFQLRPGDTGSSSVQVIALTARIQQMQTHMLKHPKEFAGKRGLQALIVRRRKMLDYLERKDFEAYAKVMQTLGMA